VVHSPNEGSRIIQGTFGPLAAEFCTKPPNSPTATLARTPQSITMDKQREWTDPEIMKMTLFLSKKLKEEKDAGVKGKYTKMVEAAEARRMEAEDAMTHAHIIEPKVTVSQPSPADQAMAEIGRLIRTRMADKKMTKYLVCKRLNEIAQRDGKTRNTLVSGTSLTNLMEGRGVNLKTLLLICEATDMELPMPRPVQRHSNAG